MSTSSPRPEYWIACLIGVALVVATGPARAIPIGFTDAALFDSAVSGLNITTEDFESSPTGDLAAGATDVGQFDIVLSNASEFNYIGPPLIHDLTTTVLNMDLSANGDPDGALQIDWTNFDVTEPIFGIGFTVDSVNASGISIEVNGSAIFFAATNQSFIGVFDTSPITRLTFTSFDEFLIIDDVRIASATAVPEPSTLAILGLAAFGFACRRAVM